MTWLRTTLLPLIIAVVTCSDAEHNDVVWNLDNLALIGGHTVSMSGDPEVIDTRLGKAVEFDGIGDGIFLDVHPLEGLSEFTVEVIFKPYADGAPEQRFFHMQQEADDSRVLFETRLVDGNAWFLDTFVKSGDQEVALYASEFEHPTGRWYHAAITVDGRSFRHFVNGSLESSQALRYEAQQAGKTSLGVRLNKVSWFKGAIRAVRFTPRVLEPEEFLKLD